MTRVHFTLNLNLLPFKERCRIRYHRMMYILHLHLYGIYKKTEWMVINDDRIYDNKSIKPWN